MLLAGPLPRPMPLGTLSWTRASRPTPGEQSQPHIIWLPVTTHACYRTAPITNAPWPPLLDPSLETFLSIPYPEFAESVAAGLHVPQPDQPCQT